MTAKLYKAQTPKTNMATLSLTISAILAIILGVLILAFPKVLRWAVGIYLIIFGFLQFAGNYALFSP